MDFKELMALLRYADNVEEIDKKRGEISELIPAVRIMFDYDQKNSFHYEDLWMHTLRVVKGLPSDAEDDMLYLAALLHDIGKPAACCHGRREGDTEMHYYGHPAVGALITKNEIIPTLPISSGEAKRLTYYIRFHDESVSDVEKTVRRHKKRGAGMSVIYNLALLTLADTRAHVMKPVLQERERDCLTFLKDFPQDHMPSRLSCSNPQNTDEAL